MSVILVDLGDDQHSVMVSNAGWRDTLALVRHFGVLDEDRVQRLESAWLGQELTALEARAIGEALMAGPLAAIDWSNNVYPPVGFWFDPNKHPWQYDVATYWPSWLRAFAGFCHMCCGFVCY